MSSVLLVQMNFRAEFSEISQMRSPNCYLGPQKSPGQNNETLQGTPMSFCFQKGKEIVDSADKRASRRRMRLTKLTSFPLCICFILLVSFGLVLDSCPSGGHRTLSVDLIKAFLGVTLNIREVGKLSSIFSILWTRTIIQFAFMSFIHKMT